MVDLTLPLKSLTNQSVVWSIPVQTSISGKDCEKLMSLAGLRFHSSPSLISTANGVKERILGYITVNIRFNNQLKPLRLFLAPNLSQPLYLGIDFFNLFNIQFQINELFSPPSFVDSSSDNVASDKPVEPLMHDLSLNQRQHLKQITDSFPSSTHLGLGRTNFLCHKIDTGLATPVKQRHYAVSPAIQAQLNQELDRMLGLGVLEESESPWSSPVTLVKKIKWQSKIVSGRSKG